MARGVGWATLIGGWSVAALIGLVTYLVLSAITPAFWILTGLVAIPSTLVAWLLLRGGKELVTSGAQSEQATKTQAILALAATRGGTLVAWDVAQALDVTPEEADALLTKLAKEQMDLVKVDLDDEGRVLYRFTSLAWANMRPTSTVRVAADAPAGGARVAPVPPAAGEPILRPEDEPAVDAYGVARTKAR